MTITYRRRSLTSVDVREDGRYLGIVAADMANGVFLPILPSLYPLPQTFPTRDEAVTALREAQA